MLQRFAWFVLSLLCQEALNCLQVRLAVICARIKVGCFGRVDPPFSTPCVEGGGEPSDFEFDW